MLEVLKQAIDYIENVPDDRDGVGHIDRDALVVALNQAIAELESQETVALEALAIICAKCRGNEWGADTPRKQILNWFHDTASKALEDAQIFRGQA